MSDTDEVSKKYREQNPYLKEWENMQNLAKQYRKEREEELRRALLERIEMRKCNKSKEEEKILHEKSESEEEEEEEEKDKEKEEK